MWKRINERERENRRIRSTRKQNRWTKAQKRMGRNGDKDRPRAGGGPQKPDPNLVPGFCIFYFVVFFHFFPFFFRKPGVSRWVDNRSPMERPNLKWDSIYWVLLYILSSVVNETAFTGFRRLFFRFYSVSAGFVWVLLGFIVIFLVLMDLVGSTWFWFIKNVCCIWFYQVLRGINNGSLYLLGFTVFFFSLFSVLADFI